MLIRVVDRSRPAFQLCKGEDGPSVFDTEAVEPPLTEREILESFRPGSVSIALTVDDIENRGMQVVPVPGASVLPPRLQAAHAEIQAGTRMSRKEFKRELREFE